MSSTPEGEVKAYLKARIAALGGEIRFAKWIGRRHAPDCRVMFPEGWAFAKIFDSNGVWTDSKEIKNCWVETKAPGKRPRPGQAREHKRMREMGEIVLVLPTKEDIDREFPAP